MPATTYFAIYPSATTPTWTRGVGSYDGWSGVPTAYGQDTTPPTTTTVNDEPTISWTGTLSSGTAYKLWAIWDNGSTSSNGPIASAEFTTPTTWTLSPGGTVVFSGTAPITHVVVNIYTITPSGSIVFSGTAQPTKDDVFDAGGTLTFSGSVEQVKEKVYLPTGNVTFSGSATMTLTNGSTEWTITPSGGITFSGAPLQIHEDVFEPSGSITFSGTNNLIKENVYEPSGSIVFSGTAPLTLVPAGSVLINTYRPLTGVGH